MEIPVYRTSHELWQKQGTVAAKHFSTDQPAGTPVESFLRATSADEIGAQAPYAKDGNFALDIHRQVLTIAKAGWESYQTIGSSSPLTLAGLSQALRNQASELRSQASGQVDEANALADKPLTQKLGAGVKAAFNHSLSFGTTVAGTALLGFGALVVGVALLAGVQLSPEMLATPTVVAGTLGVCALGAGAINGFREGMGGPAAEGLNESAAALTKRANAQEWAANHLQQWNLNLGSQ